MRLIHVTLCGLWVLALTSCVDADFARQSLVQTTRVLAVVADPPVAGVEVAPTFAALVVSETGAPLVHDPDAGVNFVWTACLVPESVPGLQGMQYESSGSQQGCGGAPAIPLVVNEQGVGTLPAGLLAQTVTGESLASVAELLGLPLSLLTEALARTGVIITVELRVEIAGRDPLVAFKRVVLQDKPHAEVIGDNPPPPRFSLRARGQDEAFASWVSARDTDNSEPWRCDWEDTPLTLRAGHDYVLDPVNVPDSDEQESDWRERYDVIDLAGSFLTLTEQPYYAWYSTGGKLDQEQTTEPADEEIWRAPATPGVYPLWLVVRDGHAGASACRVDVTVAGD